ncbi:hypothetical protein N9W28_01345 [Alphaproteobacteria bacterium]|nr:hypothetical protein [Alphaproteobacteria bacterium]
MSDEISMEILAGVDHNRINYLDDCLKMPPKKYQRLTQFLEKNKIGEEFALRCMEYLLLSSKDSGGRPRQRHYLYIGHQIRAIKEKSKKPLTNKEAIALYLKLGAKQDYKQFNIKILKASSYENILHKIRKLPPRFTQGIGSFSVVPAQYKKK